MRRKAALQPDGISAITRDFPTVIRDYSSDGFAAEYELSTERIPSAGGLSILPNSFVARFLGPKAENEALLSELIRTALVDHVNWRRSYYPGDPSPLTPLQTSAPEFLCDIEATRQAFRRLLDRMHASVPFFNGRYNGHMISEQTIASQAAYFAAMLYNANNVSPEVSPVTSELEAEVAVQLAQMIGYSPTRSWGHLTSGGTIANFEALWIARNVLYHPIAAASAAKELGIDLTVSMPDGSLARLRDLDLWKLLNLKSSCSLDLWDSLWASAPGPVVEKALRDRSLATLGYQDYSYKLAREFGDTLPPGVVIATATGHYSWEKIVRALGIGSNQLVLLPVDESCRMDPEALWEEIVHLTTRSIPIMACVSVCGSTEEGAIDQLDEILAVRSMAERKLGVTFHIHSDACYGGYAASITRGVDGSRQSAAEIRQSLGDPHWPTERWVRAVSSLEGADSVSIDPHKLGYVPYPAGAFLLKDKRARELVAIDPPYLTQPSDTGEPVPFLGRFIFEGSKPGAAAAAVWFSHQTMGLNNKAHGRLIASTVRAAHRLHENLGRADFSPFEIIRLPAPDINIVCFLLKHSELESVEQVNDLNESIYRELSTVGGATPEYTISRTRLTSPAYDGAVPPILAALGNVANRYWQEHGNEGIVVLRATVMNPFSESSNPDHMAGLTAAIGKAAIAAFQNLGERTRNSHAILAPA